MTRVLLLTVVCAASLVRPVASAESPLSRYRDVSLGDPVQVVVDHLNVEPIQTASVDHRNGHGAPEGHASHQRRLAGEAGYRRANPEQHAQS